MYTDMNKTTCISLHWAHLKQHVRTEIVHTNMHHCINNICWVFVIPHNIKAKNTKLILLASGMLG